MRLRQSVENSVSFNSSSRSRPLKLATNAFCCGLPGLDVVPVDPAALLHLRIAMLVSSVPLNEARTLLVAWRDDYNRIRPHSALANRTQEQFHDHHLALAVTNDQVQTFSPGLTL